MKSLALALILVSGKAMAINTPALPDPTIPAPVLIIPAPPPAAVQRGLDRCRSKNRTCRVEPGVGIVMEPIK